MFLKFLKIPRKTIVWQSIFNNIAGLWPVFSCKFFEIFLKSFFDRTSSVVFSAFQMLSWDSWFSHHMYYWDNCLLELTWFTYYLIAKQLYWNHTSAWVFSCKFAPYFRTPFPRSTSGWLLLKGDSGTAFILRNWKKNSE